MFLACKVEEEPKKIYDVVNTASQVLHARSASLAEKSAQYGDLKENVLTSERALLHTLAFDLRVDHPHQFLVAIKNNLGMNPRYLQTAWNFVNDSLHTDLCLQFPPRTVAAAASYMALRHTANLRETSANRALVAKAQKAKGDARLAGKFHYCDPPVPMADVDAVEAQVMASYRLRAQLKPRAAGAYGVRGGAVGGGVKVEKVKGGSNSGYQADRFSFSSSGYQPAGHRDKRARLA